MLSSGSAHPMRFGQGAIAGVLAALAGVLGLAAVLCFLFPAQLTTPQLRALYDVPLLRLLLACLLAAAYGCAVINLLLGRWRHLGWLGLASATLALLLGGATAQSDGSTAFSMLPIGLDWFVIDLLATAALFIPIEKAWPLRRDQPLIRADWWIDLKYFLVIHLLVSLFALTSTWLATRGAGWAVSPAVQGFMSSLPWVVQFALVVLIADLAQYWSHRLMHTVPFLWRFHAIHHSARCMDWLASSRLHLVEVLITRTCVLLPLYLAGFTPTVLYAYVVFIGIHAIVIHANVRLSFGPLRHLLVAPQHHHWHHSDDPRARNVNYAVHLPLLDLLFGTYYQPRGEWPASYGIGDERLPDGVLAQFLHPFRRPRAAAPADRQPPA